MSQNDRRNRRKSPGASPRPSAAAPDPAMTGMEKRLVEQARQIVDQTSEVRSEKAAAIKEALERGKYEINSRKLAQKLIIELILNR
jgi:flagellar biosynthesis anti-sigma factor FlgM